MAAFKRDMPERFFMEGISEQNIIGMAAGMALDGYIPYVNTIATFLCRRALEQICIDICLHNSPVRLIGNGGGTVYAPLGPTHMAIEDISLMRTLPNMAVVCPADAQEMARMMEQTPDWPGPLYIRLAKGYDDVVSDPELPFELGKAVVRKDGDDILLVTTGVTLQPALNAARNLDAQGLSTAIMHMHTVKPMDSEAFLNMAKGKKAIVSLEENTVLGGLGSALAEMLAESAAGVPFRRVGLPDAFPKHYGSQREHMDRAGLSARAIEQAALQLVGSTT